MVELEFLSNRPSLLLRRIGAEYEKPSGSCCSYDVLPDTAPSMVSGASAKSDLRLSGLAEISFDRSICNQVPAFAKDSTPFRTNGEFCPCALDGNLSIADELHELTAGILPSWGS